MTTDASARAEIRYLLTPDIEPETYVPEDPERFMFLVQLIAGPAGEPGEESFDFEVCSPGWLAEQARGGPVSGRHHVIVGRFDWPALVAYFEDLVARCTGADWAEVAAKLSRYGHWEFEDYRP
ncbi:immunity 8 family protein [Amycolatopsis kentuckyensis]|uniref:immunity 8 family protein n=1 Tax=Amycolatopsis kentuckyensis TaxID=218823 RepID=UPI000A38D31E|nr:immunity 8 family protein [Amycolatopsis kentuckyensis]